MAMNMVGCEALSFCIYACMYECIYICMYVHMYLCMKVENSFPDILYALVLK
jgi:type IV secretory pathway VirB3-like protein